MAVKFRKKLILDFQWYDYLLMGGKIRIKFNAMILTFNITTDYFLE